MSKTITNNARNNDAIAILHLFEFDMYNLDGTFKETLRFTDHDIFVNDGGVEHTPLAITFDKLSEDGSMQSDSINLSIDNVSGALTTEALSSEWRNNKCKIERVIYTPASDVIDSETYEYGYGDNLDTYPKLDISGLSKDQYILFEGIIDTFSATEQSLSATLTSLFTNWSKPYPSRTYNQNEFTSVVDAITETVYWGREKDV
jgi:hypothetical protein